MNEQATKAINILDEATGHLQLTRQEHVAIQQSIRFLEAELIALESLRKERLAMQEVKKEPEPKV